MATRKRIQSLLKPASLILLGCVTIVVTAQEPDDRPNPFVNVTNNDQGLTLFEAVETSENRDRSPTSRPGRESRATTAQPEFTLTGVSRIGNNYSAILHHKDGQNLIVRADPSTNTPIPEHTGYSLVAVSSRGVSIRYPGNNACIEFTDLGVSCNSAANIAELVLANGEPLPATNSATVELAAAASQADADGEITQEQVVRSNPFEALRNARRGDTTNPANDAAGTTAARFTPRRINPEDVPEGMRVVATPFGDRLVEQ